MKRIAAVALVALLAACGGDAGPTDRFSGTWAGTAYPSLDTVQFVLTPSQTGSTVTGTGMASDRATSAAITFTGISAPPSVNLIIFLNSDTLSYAGTYVSSDSIVGSLSAGIGSPIALSLKKQ